MTWSNAIRGQSRRHATRPSRFAMGALSIVLVVFVGGDTTASGGTVDDRIVVRPGEVVRWRGDGLESCRMEERTWAPVGDACWYPIDLLSEPGNIRVGRSRGGRSEEAVVTVGAYAYPSQTLTVRPRMVDPPAAELERIRTERLRVNSLWYDDRPAAFELPLHPPLVPLPTGRNFGSRRVFNGSAGGHHTGVDFSAAAGTPVLATARGVVVLTDNHYFAGNSVYIDHGHELVSMYFHLDRIDVRERQTVKPGQPIGTVGSTGRTTGDHLHFGVRWHGARIDPTQLLDPAVVVGAGAESGPRLLARHPTDSL